jgi:hypothetical protein
VTPVLSFRALTEAVVSRISSSRGVPGGKHGKPFPSRCLDGLIQEDLSKVRLIHGNLTGAWRLPDASEGVPPLFNFQWLARPGARSLFLLFTYGSRCRLFINQLFFEQIPAGSQGVVPRLEQTQVGRL